MSGWYDKDIFTEAKTIVEQSGEQPFMLFIATTQTHRPNGYVDDRLLDAIAPAATTLETAARSTDYLVDDFIRYVEQAEGTGNTVFYLFPDHAFWGEQPLLDRTGRRNELWMLTNADSLAVEPGNFHQIDLPKAILQGAGIRHNARFLTDLIQGDKNTYIDQHLKEITTLNSTQLQRDSVLHGHFSVRKQWGRVRCSINDEVIFEQRARQLRHKHIIIPLDENLKYQAPQVYSDQDLARDGFYGLCETYLDIRCNGRDFDLAWVRDNARTYRLSKQKSIALAPETQYAILQQISTGAYLLNTPEAIEKLQQPMQDEDRFQGSVLDYLPDVMADPDRLLLISAFDEASMLSGPLEPMFRTWGLQETLTGKFRWAYIAALSRDSVYVEKAAHAVLHKKLSIDGTAISLTSCGLDHLSPATVSRILIDNKEYRLPQRGLNFVIYNLKTRQVEDAFHVDTYEDETLSVSR